MVWLFPGTTPAPGRDSGCDGGVARALELATQALVWCTARHAARVSAWSARGPTKTEDISSGLTPLADIRHRRRVP
jgi:hypothetical protein